MLRWLCTGNPIYNLWNSIFRRRSTFYLFTYLGLTPCSDMWVGAGVAVLPFANSRNLPIVQDLFLCYNKIQAILCLFACDKI